MKFNNWRVGSSPSTVNDVVRFDYKLKSTSRMLNSMGLDASDQSSKARKVTRARPRTLYDYDFNLYIALWKNK